MLGPYPLSAKTPNPLSLQVSGALGPAFCRALWARNGPLLRMTWRIIPSPSHGLANKVGVCFLSGFLPNTMGWTSPMQRADGWLGGEMRRKDLGWHPKRDRPSHYLELRPGRESVDTEEGGLPHSQLWRRHRFAEPVSLRTLPSGQPMWMKRRSSVPPPLKGLAPVTLPSLVSVLFVIFCFVPPISLFFLHLPIPILPYIFFSSSCPCRPGLNLGHQPPLYIIISPTKPPHP